MQLLGPGELVEHVEDRPARVREDRLHAQPLEPLDDDARARAGLHTGLRGRLGAAGFRFGFVLHGLVFQMRRAACAARAQKYTESTGGVKPAIAPRGGVC